MEIKGSHTTLSLALNRSLTAAALNRSRDRKAAAGRLLLTVFFSAVAAFAADPPIDRMEASTVRILVKQGQQASTGSGFIIGDGSYVVTNHHVVEGADAVLVVGKDLKIAAEGLVADDPVKDLAIIKLKENSGRPAVVLSLRSGVKKTQTVLAEMCIRDRSENTPFWVRQSS